VQFAVELLRQVQIRGGPVLQYTIEARELTSESRHRAVQGESRRMLIDAVDPNEAITQYVRESAAELVSFTRPGRGDESIATVKKEDTIFLVRVYAA
jgi:hypothetical protein